MLILSGNSPGALGIFPGLNGLGRVPSSLGIDYAVPSTLVIPLASDCTVKTISVWLNAFIPGNAPGFTKPVPGGVHAGKTMLDTGDGNCFLSNGRDFSSDPNAESMLQSRVDVEIAKATRAIRLTAQIHRWGRIITVAPDTGKVMCDSPPGPVEPQPNRLKAEVTRISLSSQNDFNLSIIGQVPPPCLSGMRAPTYNVGVGVHMVISIKPPSPIRQEEIMVLTARGIIENLPAFELYASINGGASTRVFAFGLEGTFRSSYIRFIDLAGDLVPHLTVIGACSGPH
jgi:hypothetical protein